MGLPLCTWACPLSRSPWVLLSVLGSAPCPVPHVSSSLHPGVLFSRISGAEVETRVRPGDNAVLYCDCAWKIWEPVWFRNSSNEDQTPLIISGETLRKADFSRYCFVWNQVNQTKDLLVKNVSESDLGLYYCALRERKSMEDETGAVVRRDVYHYGNLTTQLSLLDPPVPCPDLPSTPFTPFTLQNYSTLQKASTLQTTSSPPVSDCSVCWKLLVGGDDGGDDGGADGVVYAQVNITSKRQNRLKKNRLELSDICTYSDVVNDQRISGAEVETRTNDLLVKNVSESDLGLYYCAVQQIKFIKDGTGAEVQRDRYRYGNRTTRLSLLGEKKDSEGQNENQENLKRTKCSEGGGADGGADGVVYTSVNITSRGQNRLKKNRVELSDICTYSECPVTTGKGLEDDQHCTVQQQMSYRL
ncbi:hypothetical protein NFI96_009125 [Prochilodus magdalenae]|nr:hypothetical protein NFI96_009125 [Prochilodus magdalenae]